MVVVSILGLLIALLLPAIQSARESARRIRCENNLRQIGLALHAYATANGSFPLNWTTPRVDPELGRPYYVGGRPYSALSRLLPYLEQATLYSTINYQVETYPDRKSLDSRENATVQAVALDVFLCPSDRAGIPGPGGCNYRGNFGVGPSISTSARQPDGGNGFFNFPNVLGPAAFTDGLSNTMAYAERIRGSGEGDMSPARDFGDFSLRGGCQDRDADFALDCARFASSREFPFSRRAGFSWFYADHECTSYMHAQEPNGPIPDAIYPTTGWGIVTARSLHPGGVNGLLADGSVRFFRQSIARAAWRALGTRSGGEPPE